MVCMTLAATRRYAFGASLAVGLIATLVAAALVTALLSGPEHVVIAIGEADAEGVLRLLLRQLASGVRAVLRLL